MPGTRSTVARRRDRQQSAMLDRKTAIERRTERRLNRDPDVADLDSIVNRMTNWQRSQWAAAGYPGLRKKAAGLAGPYVMMIRCR